MKPLPPHLPRHSCRVQSALVKENGERTKKTHCDTSLKIAKSFKAAVQEDGGSINGFNCRQASAIHARATDRRPGGREATNGCPADGLYRLTSHH